MNENDTKGKKINQLKLAFIIMIVGFILTIIAPYIFTRSTWWKDLNLTQTGTIGDTIGGITGPVVNLLGAILVYLALRAQVEANEVVQLQIKDQKKKDEIQDEVNDVNQLYTNLKDSIDNFSFTSLNTGQFGSGQYTSGSEAIYNLFTDFYCHNCHLSDDELSANPKITELISILEICNALLNKIDTSRIPNKGVMKTLSIHQFRYRVFPYLKSLNGTYSKHMCGSCQKEHGLPDDMVRLIGELDNATKPHNVKTVIQKQKNTQTDVANKNENKNRKYIPPEITAIRIMKNISDMGFKENPDDSKYSLFSEMLRIDYPEITEQELTEFYSVSINTLKMRPTL